MEQKIVAKDLYKINYYEYAKPLNSSYQGMRYRLERTPLEFVVFKSPEEKAAGKLLATVWPEPFAFDKTSDDLKETAEFPFSAEGLADAVTWFNKKYEEKEEYWNQCKMRWH